MIWHWRQWVSSLFWESPKQWELLCNRSLLFAIYIKKNVAEHISWISGRSRDGGHIFFDCISVFITLPPKPSMQSHSGCKRNKPRRLSFPLIPRLLELRGIYFQGKAGIFDPKRCQNPLDEFLGRWWCTWWDSIQKDHWEQWHHWNQLRNFCK